MFLASDTPADRKAMLDRFAAMDANVAVILGAAHLEWTLRRAIIILSIRPNRDLRNALAKAHGLQALGKVWAADVAARSPHPRLPALLSDWQGLIDAAWALRNRIVHGAGGASAAKATRQYQHLMVAAEELRSHVEKCGGNVYRRLPVRRKGIVDSGTFA